MNDVHIRRLAHFKTMLIIIKLIILIFTQHEKRKDDLKFIHKKIINFSIKRFFLALKDFIKLYILITTLR